MEGSNNHGGGRHEAYSGAIVDSEHRIALNALTNRCVERARKRKQEIRFSSKGVDAFGSTRRFIHDLGRYGSEHHPKVCESERVLDNDMMTGVNEVVGGVHIFTVEYPVEDSGVMMGEYEQTELVANGMLDERSETWYLQRGYAETRETVLTKQGLKSGELETHDYVTISNKSTAKNAGDYFGEDVMIRRTSYDPKRNVVRLDQLMMPSIPNSVIRKLYETIGVEVDCVTFEGSEDDSVQYLASQIKVAKGELKNGVADIGFLLDCILTEQTSQLHLWGEVVESVEGNPYERLFEESRRKDFRRQKVVKRLKEAFIEMVKSGDESLERQCELFAAARLEVAADEGRDFVMERYGEAAAVQFDIRKRAIESGDMGTAITAENNLQREMGDVIICHTVMGAEKPTANQDNPSSLVGSLYCRRLPRPGEKARCPCCRNFVVVAGTSEKITCSKAGCKLEDGKLKKARRRAKENAEAAAKRAKQNTSSKKVVKREKIEA